MTNIIEQRYIDKSYLLDNPTWDDEHAPWKAKHIKRIMNESKVEPKSICDIGCGSGGILVELNKIYPDAELHGYDISPDLDIFWSEYKQYDIHFHQGDVSSLQPSSFDVILAIDVLEHLADPFNFLESLKGKANQYVFHIPLDLSALSVAREKPLLLVREKVGHIHYYTKSLALAMLSEAGYKINSWYYTNAYRSAPGNNIKTKVAMLPRMALQIINKDMAVRILGGETLMVMASL